LKFKNKGFTEKYKTFPHVLFPDLELLGKMPTTVKLTDLTLNSQSQDGSIFTYLLLEVNAPTLTYPSTNPPKIRAENMTRQTIYI
jgi:hypothetical protein